MSFKKDYINYLIHTVIHRSEQKLHSNQNVKRIAEKIISADDVVKTIYLVGKTAGLEMLFKYLLYVSDKIDKSQVSIFNLKDNFEYDVSNLEKIFTKISDYHTKQAQEVISVAEQDVQQSEDLQAEDMTELTEQSTQEFYQDNDIQEQEEETEGLVLIENRDNMQEAEVFELDSIGEEENESADITENQVITQIDGDGISSDDTDIDEASDLYDQIRDIPEIRVEVRKSEDEKLREETVANEVYNRFETRFFEDVKILEKHFATIGRQCLDEIPLSSKSLQCLTEIISITSELSSLARQLSFDLIADIFLTMNIYFTRSISQPFIIRHEIIRLFDSALALVNCLIKNENYLNYDSVVEQIEKLKSEFSREDEPEIQENVETDTFHSHEELADNTEQPVQSYQNKSYERLSQDKNTSEIDSVNFKLRYLVKEFEKSFKSVTDEQNTYDRFEALEKINELNHLLRLIAKLSSSVKMTDVLRLAEVTYVFLKYIKDYRMDLLDTEIQQIIKYIIFTFKMLLTNRKPEDFHVLVQYLNNPVKIFTDS
jgi:hypothetical protein